MSLDKEKILTISAGDYCKIVGRNPCDYEAKGVHFEDSVSSRQSKRGWTIEQRLLDELLAVAPADAEAIVEYRGLVGGNPGRATFYMAASGTALIPKKK